MFPTILFNEKRIFLLLYIFTSYIYSAKCESDSDISFNDLGLTPGLLFTPNSENEQNDNQNGVNSLQNSGGNSCNNNNGQLSNGNFGSSPVQALSMPANNPTFGNNSNQTGQIYPGAQYSQPNGNFGGVNNSQCYGNSLRGQGVSQGCISPSSFPIQYPQQNFIPQNGVSQMVPNSQQYVQNSSQNQTQPIGFAYPTMQGNNSGMGGFSQCGNNSDSNRTAESGCNNPCGSSSRNNSSGCQSQCQTSARDKLLQNLCRENDEKESFERCKQKHLQEFMAFIENCKKRLGKNAKECEVSQECLLSMFPSAFKSLCKPKDSCSETQVDTQNKNEAVNTNNKNDSNINDAANKKKITSQEKDSDEKTENEKNENQNKKLSKLESNQIQKETAQLLVKLIEEALEEYDESNSYKKKSRKRSKKRKKYKNRKTDYDSSYKNK